MNLSHFFILSRNVLRIFPLEQPCLIGNLGKRGKQAPFNSFQAATGESKGGLYLHMGYEVLK